MKTKLDDVLKLYGGLQGLAAIALPVALSWRVAKFAKAVQAEATLFDEQRRKLIEQHGTPDPETTGKYTFADGGVAIDAALKELLAQEVELPAFEKIKLADLGDAKLAPATLLALEVVIAD
jgi:hypothetical protein